MNETFSDTDTLAPPELAETNFGPFQELLTEYVALEKERREHEERLEIIAERCRQLEEPLLNYFADTGMQNARVSDLTVFIKTDRFVSKRGEVTTEQVCQALRDCGLGYMVSDGYSAQSLKSKVREWQEAGVEVPERLAALLNIGEVSRLATRK